MNVEDLPYMTYYSTVGDEVVTVVLSDDAQLDDYDALDDAFQDEWGCRPEDGEDSLFEIVSVPDDLFLSDHDRRVIFASVAEMRASADVGQSEGVLNREEADMTRRLAKRLRKVAEGV